MSQTESNNFDERYAVLKFRKKELGAEFFYGVKTTGIFCKPGCASRLPNPQNVVFFDDTVEALNKGYRPCKRCRPLDESKNKNSALIAEICRIIEDSEEEPSLKVLADKTSYSETSVQKIFKQATGISPKEYAKTIKTKRLKKNLTKDSSITSAIYSAGFSSSSRIYEDVNNLLAMSPSQYKKSGAGLRIRGDVFPCSLGFVLIAFTENGVCSVELGDSKEALVSTFITTFKNAEIESLLADDKNLIEQILVKIHNPKELIDIPMDIHGTVFQKKVWNELRKIPAGETKTYSDIADLIGKPKSARAVANACGRNGIAVLIPCHRVIRKNGKIAGYKWGIERKRQLLQREQRRKKKAGPGQDQP
jgi:AraC family transcriptional regulator, regulatory protein of adaptative response / methylated-DNA-[protein]-cysteine methyltransferase